MDILDDEPITPTESYIFMALLDKQINSSDMAQMNIIKKAIELKEAIENN